MLIKKKYFNMHLKIKFMQKNKFMLIEEISLYITIYSDHYAFNNKKEKNIINLRRLI